MSDLSSFEDYVNRVPSADEYDAAARRAAWAERASERFRAERDAETSRANRAMAQLDREKSRTRLLLVLLAAMMLMWVCAGLLAWMVG